MSTVKITKITPAQTARIDEWVQKWIEIGLSTEPADFEKATNAALKVYKLCNLDKPAVVLHMSSPHGATIGGVIAWATLKELSEQVRSQVWSQIRSQVESQVESQVWSQVWSQVGSQVRSQVESQVGSATDNYRGGAFWAGWCAYISFFRDVMGWKNPTLKQFEIDEDLTKSCGWVWWHENVLAISDRPLRISRDDQGRLHHPEKMAIEYRDGWGFCSWHGTVVPSEWIVEKKLTAKQALKHQNMEQRRAGCEILGWTKVMDELDAKVINRHDSEQIGTLLEVDLPDSGKERFLDVRCGTGRRFVIPVPKEMKTALAANAWSYGLDAKLFNPEVRT